MEVEPYEQQPPSILESYRHGWETLWAHFGRLLLILILFVILQMPASADSLGALGDFGGALGALYQLLVVGPLTFGLSYTFLVAVRGRSPEVGDLFAPFQRGYVSAVLASLLLPVVLMIAALPMVGALAIAFLDDAPSPILVVGASLLVFLPVFAAVRLSFVPYLLVEEGLGPVEALGESWARTQPVQLQIFGIELLSGPLLLLGLLLLVVGVIPAMILAGLALATLYDDASSGTQMP